MPRKRLSHLTWLTWLMALALASCQTPQPALPTPTELGQAPLPNSTPNTIIITDGTAPAPTGPVVVTGLFMYSDVALTVYYAAPAVALVDLHGFVLRDPHWPIPVESQVLGHLDLNPASRQGEYRLRLPAQPAGALSHFDSANVEAAGVQVFAIAYLPNLSGGPFAEGDDARHGWPTDLASVRTRSGDDEIIGGKLVAWAAGDGQAFPTGFGADGRLFTADDPLGLLPAGYSIIDLDRAPFAVSQEHDANLPLYEATGTAVTNLAALTYSEAFEQLFSEVEQRWAFNGHSDPPVDWAALHAEVAPRVAAAEVNQDALAYFKALQLFSWRLPDGYTTISGGDLGIQDYLRETNGGYGLAVRELDDGRVLVTFVLAGGPADQAGLTVGQEVLAFNDQPITVAIGAVEPYGGPFSMHGTRRYQQARYLLRAVAGTRATLTVSGADGAPLNVVLAAVDERASFAFSSILAGYDRTALPVEAERLASGLGYVRLNSNADDLALTLTLFEHALVAFRDSAATGLILDLRQNDGGVPLGLAGYLSDQPITLGRLEYFDLETQAFQAASAPQMVQPNQRQFNFERLAVLVGPACSKACELEAYSLAQIPGTVVVGMSPTAGIAADDAGGQYYLPEGIRLRVPTGRYVLPDGRLFIEGQGVTPTVRVPVDASTALANEDVVLQAAEAALLSGGVNGD